MGYVMAFARETSSQRLTVPAQLELKNRGGRACSGSAAGAVWLAWEGSPESVVGAALSPPGRAPAVLGLEPFGDGGPV